MQSTKDGEPMILKIDFNSDEAFYLQLCNQIILGIAMETFCEGDPLPSVRSLADQIGINMHTVNKAYSILRQEGFVKLDRRRGAVISLDVDKLQAIEELRRNLYVVLARGICRNISGGKYTSWLMKFIMCFQKTPAQKRSEEDTHAM